MANDGRADRLIGDGGNTLEEEVGPRFPVPAAPDLTRAAGSTQRDDV